MTLLCHSLVLVTLFSKPAWSNLPPFDPTQEQASSPPETVTPQSAASTTTRSSPSSASRVNFDFKGFFDHFNKAFGNESLTTLQHYLNERINVDGLTPAANSLSGPVIPCGDAPSVSGASLTYKTPLRTHGSMATYTCDTGFTGNSEVIACHSGKWTDPVNPVICTIVTCPPTPPRIPNSNFHMTSSIYGSQATYTCKSGFQAVGIASPASCLQDGQWSQPNFKCANMMEMMAHNSAYQSLSSSGFSGAGVPSGGNGGLESLLLSTMQRTGSGSSVQLPSYLQGAVSSMALGMGGSVAGAIGMPGPESAPLPPHLQNAANWALMDPNVMRSFMPGMPLGTPGAGAMAGRPLEPEMAMEMLLMSQMMQNMQKQRQAQQNQQRQQRFLRQQVPNASSTAQLHNTMTAKSAASASQASSPGSKPAGMTGMTGLSSASAVSKLQTSGGAVPPSNGNSNPLMDAILNVAGISG